MNDELGDRIKSNFEDRTRYTLPRRTYTIIRLDGKAFHTYTKGLNKPFDDALSDDIDSAIVTLLYEIQGAVFAYTQSDEISILVTDFAKPTSCAWFDGNVQKITSVAASIMTAEFNQRRLLRHQIRDKTSYDFLTRIPGVTGVTHVATQQYPKSLAYFDARVFTIPDPTEVMNYFIWRNQDCSRNSVSMVAQHEFPHKELQGKSTIHMIDMLKNKGTPWEGYSEANRHGRLIVKETYKVSETHYNPPVPSVDGFPFPKEYSAVLRTRWVSTPAWRFTSDMHKLKNMIPKYPN